LKNASVKSGETSQKKDYTKNNASVKNGEINKNKQIIEITLGRWWQQRAGIVAGSCW
jgi:hypothetical protein